MPVLLLGLFLPQLTEAKEAWQWSKKELKAIAKIEKSVTQKGNEYLVESKHWKARTQIDKRFTAELVYFMELLYDTYSSTIKAKFIVDEKPEVVVFSNDGVYREKLGEDNFDRGVFKGLWESGAWTSFHVYTYVTSTKERFFGRFDHSVLMSEGSRALLQRSLGQAKAAPWLGDGLAAYFRACNLHEKKVISSKARYGRSKLRKFIKEKAKQKKPDWPELEWLLNLRQKEWDAQTGAKASLNKAYAESFVALLFTTGSFKKTLVQMIERMREKKPLLDEKQLKNLQKKWHHFLRWKV